MHDDSAEGVTQPDLSPDGLGPAGPAARDSNSGAGLDAIRRQNLSAILRRIHVAGPASRSDLVAYTGLNRSTVAALVADLSERGIVRERQSTSNGMPGRPSPVVDPDPNGVAVLALEVFADSLGAATIGLGGRIIAQTRIARTRAPLPPEATAQALATIVGPLLAHPASSPAPRIVAVGAAVAGLVRHGDGVVVHGPNLGWRDVPLARLLSDVLQLDVPVLVANDGDLAALAEHVRGAGVGCDDFVCLWAEVGIGAGIIAGGRPLTGRSGFAGEVGHLPLSPNRLPCHCGAVGCWETEVGEDAILRAAGVPLTGGRPAVEAIVDAADRGDPVALAALQSVGAWLGIGLAALVDLLNPGRIALGGLLALIHPHVQAPIERTLGNRGLAASRAVADIVPARLGTNGPLLGAAELAFESILADPASVPRIPRSAPSTRTRRPRGGKEVRPGVLAN